MLAYMNIVGALINADDTVMNSYIVGVPLGGEGILGVYNMPVT